MRCSATVDKRLRAVACRVCARTTMTRGEERSGLSIADRRGHGGRTMGIRPAVGFIGGCQVPTGGGAQAGRQCSCRFPDLLLGSRLEPEAIRPPARFRRRLPLPRLEVDSVAVC